MNRTTLLIVTLIVCLVSMSGLPLRQAHAATPHERSFEFEYKATVKDIPPEAKQVDLWMPVPHDSPFQRITDLQIESPYPYQTHTAQYGNRVLHISLNQPRPSSFTVTMRFNIVRVEHIQERLLEQKASLPKGERDPDMTRWLQPDRLVPIDGKVKQWAQEVVDAAGAKSDLEKARAIYNHVVSTVKYVRLDKAGAEATFTMPAMHDGVTVLTSTRSLSATVVPSVFRHASS